MPFTIEGNWIPSNLPIKKKPSAKLIKRKNSQITLIEHLHLSPEELQKLCALCKKKWGCGGTVKEDTIEIQGNKLNDVKLFLRSLFP